MVSGGTWKPGRRRCARLSGAPWLERDRDRDVRARLCARQPHTPQSGAQQLWRARARRSGPRSEEHTSELPSLMRISYAVFCLQKNKRQDQQTTVTKDTLTLQTTDTIEQ